MLRKFSRVLVVDDSQTMRSIVKAMLNGIGLDNIDQAPDGRTALALLKDQRYSLVVSDWNMKPMNGLELLQDMRKLAFASTTPFIMMTAHAVRYAAVAREHGALHYLAKPFTREELASKIAQATSGIAA